MSPHSADQSPYSILPSEPEQLPALSDLDLNSLTETHQPHSSSHYNHHYSYISRPITPSRQYSTQTIHPHQSQSQSQSPTSSHLHLEFQLDQPDPDQDQDNDEDLIQDTADTSLDSYYDYDHHSHNPGDLPPELISLIVHHLFYTHHPYPSPFPSPDPYLSLLSYPFIFSLSSANLAPPLDAQAKEALSHAALVNKVWNAEATRALWRRVSFGMPRDFESVLRTIEEYSGGRRVKRQLPDEAGARGVGGAVQLGASLGLQLFGGGGGGGGGGGDETIKASSKEKGRAGLEFVERWRREGSEGCAVEGEMERPMDIDSSLPPPIPLPSSIIPSATFTSTSSRPLPFLNPRDSPLLFTRSISFARFRTAGMKRSIRSGKEERFVTPERLLKLLKGTRYPKRKLKVPVEVDEQESEGGMAGMEKEGEGEGLYGGRGFRGFGVGAGKAGRGGGESEAETETETESESETPSLADGAQLPGGNSGFGRGETFGGWGRRSRKKVAGQLCQVGLSEYMDSAITLPVLEELLFRGGYLAEYSEPDLPPSLLPDFLPPGSSAASATASEAGGTTPYLNSASMVLTPGEQQFHYKDLRRSHSRSPSSDDERGRSQSIGSRRSSLSTSIAEVDEPSSAPGSSSSGGVRTPILESGDPVDGNGQGWQDGEIEGEDARTPEQEYPDHFGPRDPVQEDAEMGEGARTPIGRRPSYRRRRSSGARFAPLPSISVGAGGGTSTSPDTILDQSADSELDDFSSSEFDGERTFREGDEDGGGEEDARGRSRGGRGTVSGLSTPALGGRGRSRFPMNRSLPSSLASGHLSRSASLPAPHHHHHSVHFHPSPRNEGEPSSASASSSLSTSQSSTSGSYFPQSGLTASNSSFSVNLYALAHPHALSHALTPSRSRNRTHSLSRASERSSSVPASVSGRHGGYYYNHEPVPKRTVQILEGSVGQQSVRALDLCGCVSRVFVAALGEFVERYKLGPPALASQLAAQQDDAMDEDEDEDEDDPFGGRRTPSVRSLRLGFGGPEERILNRTFFPHLRRLGLASSLLPSHLLTAFVLSFPYLTHLDLASTLTSPLLLKGLALAGQSGIGSRPMRLKALSLARCRLITGPALLGLLCGDCPPLTTMAGISDDEDESWGAGEVVSELTDLSLFGDGTYPSPLEGPELRLVLTVSPAFRSGLLRTVDLSSTPMTDVLLSEHFPPQPNLIELGLASCRAITMQAVSTFLCDKAPSVEILDLSHSCPSTVGSGISSRRRTFIGAPTISIMELHAVLLSQCASLESASENEEEAQLMLALRRTNLRVVELDEKSLELVQGGAGEWKALPGKGRRGWYVDTSTTSGLPPYNPSLPYPRPRQLVHLPKTSPQRLALLKLVSQHSAITFEVGWHSRKMEILRGDGLMGGGQGGGQEGLYAFHAFA
ncbi:hypothetical protein JCM11641_003370 [Rhodosporidiobolus odoratus]